MTSDTFQNERDFDLTGFAVTELCFGYALTINCMTGFDKDRLTIILVGRFKLTTTSGEHSCVPEDASTMGIALELLHKDAISLVAHRDGRLIVNVAGPIRITVEPDGPYESWEATGQGKLASIRFLCDGGSALW